MGKNKDIYQYLTDKGIKAWANAQECNCHLATDCAINHKRCALCGHPVIFGAYEAMQPNSRYNWNVDHIIPKARFVVPPLFTFQGISGPNDLNNLQITHVYCNQYKGDDYNGQYKNGFGSINNPNFD